MRSSQALDGKIESVMVTVIIATYRRDESLEKSLRSVIDQTYKAIEIIVVDDNGQEYWNSKVLNIINNLNHLHPIIYVKNLTNKGSAETRNIGIRIASGELITFLDDDDLYLPNKVKNQAENMMRKSADFCITDINLYDERNRLIERRNRKYIKKVDQDSLLSYHLMYHMTGTDSLMFKRDYLLSIGNFPPIDVGDEYYLMQKAIEGGGLFSYLPSCDIKAYVHSVTDGLSSGESKIEGENNLYNYKKKFFYKLNAKEIKYIKMRHFAVLAFAKLRKKDIAGFLKNAFFSFFSDPYQCTRLFFLRKF
ncbi:glycosyltransferase family 2 protein [Paenibacillus sp. NPDC058367]|uniref:glycosyltransferase family 2 protein n=1 Tax=Paenibacillus sp. NPDC058367 TaxID=3346460 RepID=UPI00365246D1